MGTLWNFVLTDSLQKVKGWVVRLIRGKNTEGLVLMGAIKLARHRASSTILCAYNLYATLNFHLSQDNNCKNI